MSDTAGKKNISRAIISRLPRYYRYLGQLKSEGVDRISSGELSKRMGATASQIRQDLNHFGGFGQQGYGYNVGYLYDEIAKILHLDKTHRLILIGAGHLGTALCRYRNLSSYGFSFVSAFDIDPEKIGTLVNGIPVRDMAELEDFIDSFGIEIAVLCIPTAGAPEVLERLKKTSVAGVWNFAHLDYDLGPNKVLESVHLSESLMILNYEIFDRDHAG